MTTEEKRRTLPVCGVCNTTQYITFQDGRCVTCWSQPTVSEEEDQKEEALSR